MNRLGACRWMLAMLLIAFASLNAAASAGCSTCSGGSGAGQVAAWQENINKWAGEEIIATTASATQETATPREGSFVDVLVPASAVESTDIVLDVRAEGSDYIEGTIALPYTRFLTNEGAPKSVEEIAELLGGAGVNQDNTITLAGSDPSQAAYVYWALKYLGHQKVQILDTTAENWNSGQRTSQTLLPTTYTPTPNQELLASPDYLNSGNAQVVDARSMQEFGMGSIPGAINTPSEAVIEDGRIKDQAALERVFGFLNRQKPVIVYGESAQQCSPVWLALTLLDYDARLYPKQS